ncbi:ester cyclase [Streptomyces sp. B1866]|uniref:ester cyclase n=1 Tax=Streptomyces sp. B1866 TaxID=3075431 RepID=UPI00288CB26D|nr:ester cyclase [Streptomyces sp. B1866]MDT3395889.1 ester cyclase [Streptomyces sp. B1866]
MTAPAAARVADAGLEAVWAWVHEGGNARRLTVADRLVTGDFALHGPPCLGTAARGPQGLRDHLTGLHRAFPDLLTEVADLFGHGDRVVARLLHRGTHRGPWLGVPATGRTVEFSQTVVFRTAGAKIAEAWQEIDAAGTLFTLGGAPPMGSTPASALGWALTTAHRRVHHRVPQRQPWPWRGTARQHVPPFPGALSGTGEATEEQREANTLPLRRWIDECVNQQDTAVCEEVFHADYVGHSPPHAEPEPLHGPAGYARFLGRILTGFPDARAEIQDLVPVDDRVACRVRMTGTHLNAYRGLPATGRPFVMTQTVICRIEDGRIVESWQEIDALGMMLQFGVVPRIGTGPLGHLAWFAALAGTLATAPRRIAAHSREAAR